MSFYSANLQRLCQFNSAASSDFISLYEAALKSRIKEHEERQPSPVIAPSSFRCARKSWFRLRSVKPDELRVPDTTNDHFAFIGTSVHARVQTILSEALGNNWVSVEDHLKENAFYEYETSKSEDGLETRVKIYDPPINFSVDGIVQLGKVRYLFEAKSVNSQQFNDLVEVREKDKAQVEMYCTYLKLYNSLIFYIDRTYGEVKCYEYDVKDSKHQEVKQRVADILEAVDSDLAPARLDRGRDVWCSECNYRKSCSSWG